VEEFISLSKRLILCNTEDEICPFCMTKPSRSQAGFASHVGKHQQEISLAALPRLDDYSDDESTGGEDENDDDDSDDSDDDGDDDNRTKGTDEHEIEAEERLGDTKLETYIHDRPLEIMTFTAENSLTMSKEELKTTPSIKSETSNRPSLLVQSGHAPHHSHSLSNDSQQSINTTWGPQNRLIYSIRDFEKTLGKCEDLCNLVPSDSRERFSILANVNNEVQSIRRISTDLASHSSNLDRTSIEISMESLAICRTQLLRLQKVLEFVIYYVDVPEKNSKRPNVILRQLFTRQQSSPKSELSKAQDILTELRAGGQTLRRVNKQARGTSSNLSNSGSSPKPAGPLLERGPQLILSPTGTLVVSTSERQEHFLKETNVHLEGARPNSIDDYEKHQSFWNEPTQSKSREISYLNTAEHLLQNEESAKALQPGPSSTQEYSGPISHRESSEHRVSIIDPLPFDDFPPGGLGIGNANNDDPEDDLIFTCRGCGEIVSRHFHYSSIPNGHN